MKQVVALGLLLFLCQVYAGRVCEHGSITIAESIPIGVDFKPDLSTLDAWLSIINSAKHTVDIGQFYITLTEGASDWPAVDGGWEGKAVYDALISAHKRGVRIRLVTEEPNEEFPDTDGVRLAKEGIVEYRGIKWEKLMAGGILHTKLIIGDSKDTYLGSANFDWRSLVQTKELGAFIHNCSELVEDIQKEFEMYWILGNSDTVPKWNSSFSTEYNLEHPATVFLNDTEMRVFTATSPPLLTADGRTGDIQALLDAIYQAEKSVCIQVMDYCPCSLYGDPNYYWGRIDEAIRNAAFRGVSVRFMTSTWKHTIKCTLQYFYSLNQLENVQVKTFIVPPLEPPLKPIPYTRVNHPKYMVTDKQTYIGTSNWSADYFTNTGGMSTTWYTETVREKAQDIFNRDWNSKYVHDLPPPGSYNC